MKKSRITAAVLAFLVGTFGIDRFYLNQAPLGIFLVLFTIMSITVFGWPLSGIIGVVHAFKLITMSDEKFDEKHNKKFLQKERDRQARGQNRVNKNKSRTQKDMSVQREKYRYDKQSKSRANPFIKSGQSKYKEYNLEGAAEDFEQALELSPDNRGLHFNMASVYSLMEKKDKAFYHIEQAVKLGFKDFDKIKTHDDLAYLRIQPEFDAFKANGYFIKNVKGIEPPIDGLLQDDRLLTQLNKLKDLRDRGLLSEKEFVYEKEKISKR